MQNKMLCLTILEEIFLKNKHNWIHFIQFGIVSCVSEFVLTKIQMWLLQFIVTYSTKFNKTKCLHCSGYVMTHFISSVQKKVFVYCLLKLLKIKFLWHLLTLTHNNFFVILFCIRIQNMLQFVSSIYIHSLTLVKNQ